MESERRSLGGNDQAGPEDPTAPARPPTRADETVDPLVRAAARASDVPIGRVEEYEALRAGARLGPYEILAPLGAGGMGEVYRARDPRLGREVAIKVLPPEYAASPDWLGRFEREARAAGALNHPNILAIHDVGTEQGSPYLVSELLEGETLRRRLQGAKLPWPKAIDYALQIAEGLATAHEKGIVHRDLKPDNLFVTLDDRVKILDFGLAKLSRPADPGEETSFATESGKVLGTVGYMSPEQVRGAPADARSDLFSLGCVLYEMIAGERAFSGKTDAERLAALLKDDPPGLSGREGKIPGAVRPVLARCLEKIPEKRFPSARDLAASLRALSGESRPSPTWRLRLAAWMAAALAAFSTLYLLMRSAPAPEGLPRPKIASLAVLPLANLSRDPDQEYFSDGMTEMLIGQLAQIRALKVISRTSAMYYKGTRKPLREIARDLNVDAVVEGSVTRLAGRVRITAQLIYAATDTLIWAHNYERDTRDIFTLQSEVARAIADEIQAKLTPQERARLATSRPASPEAHEAYLKGRHFWSQWTTEGFRKAREYFLQAIANDPNYGAAYAGLADSYAVQSFYGLVAPGEAIPKAKAAAVKALELDETLAEAHSSLGVVKQLNEWNWLEARRAFQRAIELQPSSPRAHQLYAWHLSFVGRFEEAIAEIKRARELDPLSPVIRAMMGAIFYMARQYDEAIDQCRRTLELDPNFRWANHLLGEAYIEKGMYREAMVELRKSIDGPSSNPHFVAVLGYAHARAGHRREALEVVEKLKTASQGSYVPPTQIGMIYAGLNQKDEAFAWLERGYDGHDTYLAHIKVGPYFDPLRNDPRFRDLLRRMNFPE